MSDGRGDFRPGDTVQLRSGGAVMTLHTFTPPTKAAEARLDPLFDDPQPDPGWLCVWHCQGTARAHVYPAHVLRAAEPQPEPVRRPVGRPPKLAAVGD